MKGDDIVEFRVVGCQVDASAEPPAVAGFEVAHIHVNGRDVGVPRMDDETDAGGEKRGTRIDLELGSGAGGKARAADRREIDASPLNGAGAFPDARDAAALAFGVVPTVFAAGRAVLGVKEGRDMILDGTKRFLNGIGGDAHGRVR